MLPPSLLLALPLRSLLRHKSRSALTMLGITIGIASLIVIVAVGDGAAREIERRVRSLGSNLILVIPASRNIGGVSLGAGTRPGLTPDDVEAIRREVPGVKAVSPVVEGSGHLAGGGRNWAPASIKGEGEEYLDVKSWDLTEGAFFSRDDVDAARSVCVLGEVVREALFPDEEAIGALVRIGNMPFRVVGVLGRRGHASGEDSQDDVVIVPWTTVQRVLQGSRFNDVDYLLISGRDEKALPGVAQEVAALLRDRHPSATDDDPPFKILSMVEVARLAKASAGIMTPFLTIVASLSLAVGGVGITNILLITVKERTPEIGIRIAVGARSVDILAQFLCEGVLTALVAGVAGIGLGSAVALGLGRAFDWPIRLSPGTAGGAALASAAVGLFFGAYPSIRASRLDPIVALRGA
jgi:putative ABC transport system permease protein